MHTNHKTPKKIVMRSRFRSTTEDEPRVELTPPPNRSDSPPPLPLWSSTRRIITRLVMIRITESPTTIAVIHLLLVTRALVTGALPTRVRPTRTPLVQFTPPVHDTGRSERTARRRGWLRRRGHRRCPAAP